MSQKPYSNALNYKDTIYTSGQIAIDADGKLCGADIYSQTTKTLENVYEAISGAGFSKHNIVSMTIYLNDIENDFAQFNEAFKAFFGECKPTRATLGATLFKPEYLIEIQAIADKNIDNRL